MRINNSRFENNSRINAIKEKLNASNIIKPDLFGHQNQPMP